MDFLGIKSLDQLIKLADIPQTEQAFGEQGQNANNVTELIARPVPSMKLPGASKGTHHKYPEGIVDESKVMSQEEAHIHPQS
jgi:hypothetical protein